VLHKFAMFRDSNLQNAIARIYHHRVAIIDAHTWELLEISKPFRLPNPLRGTSVRIATIVSIFARMQATSRQTLSFFLSTFPFRAT
jgi:hypothetical protein